MRFYFFQGLKLRVHFRRRATFLRGRSGINDPDLEDLVRDLLGPDDEVLAGWPPSGELARDGVQLLVADEDDLPADSPLGELARRWSAELPTVLLDSRLAVSRRKGRCLVLPKPIPLRLFGAFVNALR